MKNNQLTHKQSFILCNWMVTNKELLTSKSMVDAAEMATTFLKFPVTMPNILSARDTTELELFRQSKPGTIPRDRLSVVAKYLVDLLIELGKKPTEDLISISQRRSEKEQS